MGMLKAKPGLLISALDGGALEMRVMRLLDSRVLWGRRVRVVVTAGCFAALGVLAVGVVSVGLRPVAAQTARALKFDVVSVKPHAGPGVIKIIYTSDGFSAENAPLGAVVREALDTVRSEQVEGMPDWVRSARYDITAKVAETDAAAFGKLSKEEKDSMVQEVLAERFGLKFHTTSREMPVYALVIAKSGLKMKEAHAGDAYGNGFKDRNGTASGAGLLWLGPGHLIGQGASMETLVSMLGGDLDRMVIDKTGLMGRYDFELQFADANTGAAADTARASAFTEVEEKLGLRLEPAKGPVEFVVVDRIERPTEN